MIAIKAKIGEIKAHNKLIIIIGIYLNSNLCSTPHIPIAVFKIKLIKNKVNKHKMY